MRVRVRVRVRMRMRMRSSIKYDFFFLSSFLLFLRRWRL